jgi:hypothetical protein
VTLELTPAEKTELLEMTVDTLVEQKQYHKVAGYIVDNSRSAFEIKTLILRALNHMGNSRE